MQPFILRTADDCKRLWSHIQAHWCDSDPPLAVRVQAHRETRSTAQNDRMWAMLDDVSRQVDWHGQKLAAEDWKHVFTAALKKQRVVPNLDGDGFVVLGARTSRMTIAEMTELMDLMEAFGAEQNVRFATDRETT